MAIVPIECTTFVFFAITAAYIVPRRPKSSIFLAVLLLFIPVLIPLDYYGFRAFFSVTSFMFFLRLLEMNLFTFKRDSILLRHNELNVKTELSKEDEERMKMINKELEELRLLGVYPDSFLRRFIHLFMYFDSRQWCLCGRKNTDSDFGQLYSVPASAVDFGVDEKTKEEDSTSTRIHVHDLKQETREILKKFIPLVLTMAFFASCQRWLTFLRPSHQKPNFDVLFSLPFSIDIITASFDLLQASVQYYPTFYAFLRWLCCSICLFNALETLDTFVKLLLIPFGAHIPLHHRIQYNPLKSRSLNEWWSRRWNAVIQKRILRRWVFYPIQTYFGSYFATFLTFVMSGLMHAIPLWMGFGSLGSWRGSRTDSWTQEKIERRAREGWYWGTLMFMFFMVQMAGMMVERKVLKVKYWPWVWLKRAWVWWFIASTSYLVVEPLLQMMEA